MNNFINFTISEQRALLGFNCLDCFGFKKVEHLKNFCGSYQKAFIASSATLLRSGLTTQSVNRFLKWRNSFDFSKLLASLEKGGIKFISLVDESYPYLLKEIASPPLVLFYLGNLSLITNLYDSRLAIVGSRKANEYTSQILNVLMPALTNQGIVIISGLARGADTKAHREAIKNNGKTIAVLGTGLDWASLYPQENIELAKDIIKNFGLLLSEFPPGTKARPMNFPRRNRLISGLSQATLVVQAEKKSGSLITAAHALEQNREVLSIPGNVFCHLSQGTNNLIKEGAIPITNANDILEVYSLRK